MNDRYSDRYRRDPDRREQRAGSWRDEGPDRYWGRRERFGSGESRSYHRYDRNDIDRGRYSGPPYGEQRPRGLGPMYDLRTEDEPQHYRAHDDDPGMRAGTWSIGHGGATEHGYSGGLGSWQPREERYAGRGPRNYRRSDKRILEDVNEALTMHPDVDATDVEVSVNDGEVALDGAVNTRDEKRLSEDCAWNVSGVREVHNRLRVNVHDGSSERGGALRI